MPPNNRFGDVFDVDSKWLLSKVIALLWPQTYLGIAVFMPRRHLTAKLQNSVFVLAETSDWSPDTFFIVILQNNVYGIKVSKKQVF